MIREEAQEALYWLTRYAKYPPIELLKEFRGASDFIIEKNYVSFHFTGCLKANIFKIEYDGRKDLFNAVFLKKENGKTVEVERLDSVYNDDLNHIFVRFAGPIVEICV